MRTQPPDTDPEIERLYFEGLERAGDVQKIRWIGSLGRMVAEVALAEIRARHPGAADRETRLRLASRVYDRELLIRAFGWDPDVEGR